MWVHEDREYTEPPVGMIVDAILRHVHGTTTDAATASPYSLPENLRRFFAGRTAAAQPAEPTEAPTAACCPPAEQHTCCDASAKDECCGDPTEQGCGCQ